MFYWPAPKCGAVKGRLLKVHVLLYVILSLSVPVGCKLHVLSYGHPFPKQLDIFVCSALLNSQQTVHIWTDEPKQFTHERVQWHIIPILEVIKMRFDISSAYYQAIEPIVQKEIYHSAAIVDLLRYIILWKFGGNYADLDSIVRNEIRHTNVITFNLSPSRLPYNLTIPACKGVQRCVASNGYIINAVPNDKAMNFILKVIEDTMKTCLNVKFCIGPLYITSIMRNLGQILGIMIEKLFKSLSR